MHNQLTQDVKLALSIDGVCDAASVDGNKINVTYRNGKQDAIVLSKQ